MTGEVKEAAVTGFGLNCYQVSEEARILRFVRHS